MSSIRIKPKQSVYILLNKAHAMNNPRLSIRLEENVIDDGVNDDDYDDEQTDDSSDILMFQNQNRICMNCDSLKKMINSRDRTILKLIEDRDQLKIKLTKAMNQNIELSRQMLKYQPSAIKRSNMQNSDRKSDEKYRTELDFYKKRCQELDEMNQQLKNHLYSLRNVFAELGNVDGDDNDEDEEENYQNLPEPEAKNTTEEIPELNGNHHHNNNGEDFSKPTTSSNKETKIDAKKSNELIIKQGKEPVLSNFDVWYNS